MVASSIVTNLPSLHPPPCLLSSFSIHSSPGPLPSPHLPAHSLSLPLFVVFIQSCCQALLRSSSSLPHSARERWREDGCWVLTCQLQESPALDNSCWDRPRFLVDFWSASFRSELSLTPGQQPSATMES